MVELFNVKICDLKKYTTIENDWDKNLAFETIRYNICQRCHVVDAVQIYVLDRGAIVRRLGLVAGII